MNKVREALIGRWPKQSACVARSGSRRLPEEIGENAIDFELVVWSSEMSHRPSRFKSDLNFAIEEKFRKAGIEIPFPRRDLHLRGGSLRARE